MSYALGIDIGGTNIKAGLISRDGEVLQRTSLRTEAKKGLDHVLHMIEESVDAVLAPANLTRDRVDAIGIGAPGPMNWKTGVVFAPPNLPGWKNVPLAQLMEQRLGVQCFVDNDANCACFGEFWRGAGRDVDHMCLMTLGTGVGGGIVIWGRLLRGVDGTAGEIGHMRVEHEGRQCNCGARGCLEVYASATALVRNAREKMAGGAASALRDHASEKITSRIIAEHANDGDEFCLSIVRETGRWLGVACADLINLLNPEMIVFSGGLANAGEILLEPIRETAWAMAFVVPARHVKIVRAELGNDAGIVGAAGCAIQRLERGENA